MNAWEMTCSVMLGVLWAQLNYNLLRYLFKRATGYLPEQHPDRK